MKPLNQFVRKRDPLGRLRTSAAQLDALVRSIRTVLPAEAREHVIGCAPRPGTVVVLADSAAWATQLRYLQQDILSACQKQFGDRVQHVQFKVLPPQPVAGKPPAAGLSEDTRQLLRGTASSISDTELAAALRRLSEPDQDAD